jgi:hypothetical protein
MLAPLGFFLLSLFATFALLLLTLWVLDADRTGIQSGRDRPMILEFPVHPDMGRPHLRRPAPRFAQSCGVHGRLDGTRRNSRATPLTRAD